jgi:hypothetical protein
MNKPTPADATKKFAAFYAESRRFIDGLSEFSDGGKLQGMSLKEFHENYSYVGTYAAKSLDEVFGLLQDGGGGLGVEIDRETLLPKEETVVSGKTMQELLVRKIGHTSMSKGDVLVDLGTGDIFLCASFGWDKIVITGMRAPVEA